MSFTVSQRYETPRALNPWASAKQPHMGIELSHEDPYVLISITIGLVRI